jgi:hypothetical protein
MASFCASGLANAAIAPPRALVIKLKARILIASCKLKNYASRALGCPPDKSSESLDLAAGLSSYCLGGV